MSGGELAELSRARRPLLIGNTNMRLIHGGILLTLIAALSSCKRELAGAACPCIEGWHCCATRNICISAEATCTTGEDTHPLPSLVTSTADAYFRKDGTLTEVTGGIADVTGTELEIRVTPH